MNKDMPDYGTPPEPKYGAYDKERFDRESIRIARGHGMTPPPEPAPRWEQPTTRRDPFGIVLAVVLLVFAAGLALLALQGGWWSLLWVVFAPFVLFGAVGLAHDIPKVPRDEDGRHIR